jgi:hypothetical protein
MVPGNDHERDAACMESSGRSGNGHIGPGPGPDRIKKIARVDEHVGFLPDDRINRRQEIVIDLLLAQGSCCFPGPACEKAARPRWVSVRNKGDRDKNCDELTFISRGTCLVTDH